MKRFFLVFMVFVLSCAQSKTKPITEFSQNDINDAILIDVRTPEEYALGHIDNAININFFDQNFVKQIATVDTSKTVYLYCKKGGRSAKAATLLDSLGYKNVIDLAGGYDAWVSKNK